VQLTQNATTVWLDGRPLEGAELHLHALTHALHYGSNVFEGIRCYPTDRGPAVFRLREHVDRLLDGAARLGLRPAYDAQALCAAVVDTVGASGLQAAYIRPLVFFGGQTVRLNPSTECPTHVLIAVFAFDGIQPGNDAPRFRAAMSPVMKTPSRSQPSTVKAGAHYANSLWALSDAQRRGFDEAILLNEHGDVAEGSGENIFIVRDGVLATNDATADVLLGITRRSILELAGSFAIPTEIRPISVSDLLGADEAFFTGTAAEVVPIVSVDDHAFPGESPVTERLRTAYADIVRGRLDAPGPWLTYVS
jgi:branched-chain amino acid aminotransferase